MLKLVFVALVLAGSMAGMLLPACGPVQRTDGDGDVSPTATETPIGLPISTRSFDDNRVRHFNDTAMAESIVGFDLLEPAADFYVTTGVDGLIFPDDQGEPAVVRRFYRSRVSSANLIMFQRLEAGGFDTTPTSLISVGNFQVELRVTGSSVVAEFLVSVDTRRTHVSVEGPSEEEVLAFIRSLNL